MWQRSARKRILTMAGVLFICTTLVLLVSMRPQSKKPPTAPPVNLGTATMQAEVMAALIDLRWAPVPKMRQPVMPMKAIGIFAPAGSHRPAGEPAPEDVARTVFGPPSLKTDTSYAVMDWTLPYCSEGGETWVCQDSQSVVEWRDDESAASFRFRQNLEQSLHMANLHATQVPQLALELSGASAHRMSRDELRQRRARGIEGCKGGSGNRDLDIMYLQRPVFSSDGRWAMATVASDTCEGGLSTRVLYLLHHENGKWSRISVERAGPARNGRGLWPMLPPHR